MSEMVERVARALAVADGKDPDAPAWIRYPGAETFGLCWRDQYADAARAAIEAMKEPTPTMRRHGDKAMSVFSSSHEVYRRMLLTALKEEEPA